MDIVDSTASTSHWRTSLVAQPTQDMNGKSFLSSTSEHEILTDASDQGQGIV
jgi:hypothetical protein